MGYLTEARRGAWRAIGLQCLVAVVAGMLALLISSLGAAEAAVLGAAVCIGANLALVVWVFAGKVERDPQWFLLRMMLGELFKFVVAAILFMIAIAEFKAAFLPLMSGYFATLVAYWVGLFKSNIGRMK